MIRVLIAVVSYTLEVTAVLRINNTNKDVYHKKKILNEFNG